MNFLRVENTRRSLVIGDRIRMASNPWLRFKGLMGVRTIQPGTGMLFPHTNVVHGFFMRIPLLLVYLGPRREILQVAILKPWRIGPFVSKARFVLEMPADTPRVGLLTGDRLDWHASPPAP